MRYVICHNTAHVVRSLLLVCLLFACASSATIREELVTAQSLERGHDYVRAESSYVAFIVMHENNASVSPSELLTAYTQLAAVRLRLSRYDEAEEAYERAMLLATVSFGSENAAVVEVLNGLGRIEFIRGNFDKSERTFRRALRMAEEIGVADQPVAATAFRGQADVARQRRGFYEGENYAYRALEIVNAHPEMPAEEAALTYVSLAFNFRGRGAYNAAEQNFLKAQTISRGAYGENHPVCATIYNHQAALHNNHLRGREALLNANRAMDIAVRLLGPEHFEAGIAHFNLAKGWMYIGDHKKAAYHYERTLEILTKRLGPKHPEVASAMSFYSFNFSYINEFDEAMRWAKRAADIRLEHHAANGIQLDENAAVIFALATYYAVSGYPAYYFEAPHTDSEQSRILAELILSSKGMVNEEMYNRARFQATTTDPRTLALSDELADVRARKSNVYAREPMRQAPETIRLFDSLEHCEKYLLSELAESRIAAQNFEIRPHVRLEEVCSRIPEGACLVEFYPYHYVYPLRTYKEEARTGALVLDRHGIRAHRYLGHHHGVLYPIIDTLVALLAGRSQSQTWDALERARFDALSRQIWTVLWKPIDDLIQPGELVLVAPDVEINLISFGSLLRPDGQYQIERNPIQYLFSGRELRRLAPLRESNNELIAIFDPNFEATARERLAALPETPGWTELASSDQYAIRNVRPACDRLDSLDLPRLRNTGAEIERIAKTWTASANHRIKKYSGAAATEEVLKRVAPGHGTIHIATHGYFVEPECRGLGSYYLDLGGLEADLLLYSGLLMAGANHSGADALEVGAEDGILTAEEVSSLNLRGTDLVVLSACKTGVGALSQGQGSMGVTRAFLMAGARQVVGSLWPVADAATIDVMTHIYDSPDKCIAEKLQQYAIQTIQANRAAGRPTDPYTWAAFVSYGDWRVRE